MKGVNTVGGSIDIHRNLLDILADQVMSTLTLQSDPNAPSDCQLTGESFFFSSRQLPCSCEECKAYRRVLASL
ncbi:hypothetical protein [Pseudomonas matsuisoli]|uniref:Uncharacterized protein n=1 Tax=Pseudomonas matsuisoli TaxID=1515666 RepID=A0A917UYY5_9PSED|nr:hypothetical protein [Pseudomonas matsuisoli]GGJ98621.1 hypothetical protein GCM10009304_25600 [Pseudomonas matsuisoli]